MSMDYFYGIIIFVAGAIFGFLWPYIWFAINKAANSMWPME